MGLLQLAYLFPDEPAAYETLVQLNEQINALVPLDLSVTRERLGNVLFQFPVRLLVSSSQALPNWNGVRVSFHWHPKLTVPPTCMIQVEAELDQIYLGSAIETYAGAKQQDVLVGNLEGLNSIKIWRTSPALLLSLFKGIYIRNIDFRPSIIHPERRLFKIGDQT